MGTSVLHNDDLCHLSKTLRNCSETGNCSQNVCEATITSTCNTNIDALDRLRRLVLSVGGFWLEQTRSHQLGCRNWTRLLDIGPKARSVTIRISIWILARFGTRWVPSITTSELFQCLQSTWKLKNSGRRRQVRLFSSKKVVDIFASALQPYRGIFSGNSVMESICWKLHH